MIDTGEFNVFRERQVFLEDLKIRVNKAFENRKTGDVIGQENAIKAEREREVNALGER